jgi:hypothetical protein
MWKPTTKAVLLVLGLGGAAALAACEDYYYPYTYGYGPAPTTAPAYSGYYSGSYAEAASPPAPGTTVSVLGCPIRNSSGCDTLRDSTGMTWDVTRAGAPPEGNGAYAIRFTGRVSAHAACTGGPALENVTWTRTGEIC